MASSGHQADASKLNVAAFSLLQTAWLGHKVDVVVPSFCAPPSAVVAYAFRQTFSPGTILTRRRGGRQKN
jgi:hypothetical protein